MTYKFLTRPLEDGVYEPEGIYLNLPLEGDGTVVQFWGDNPDYYHQFYYNGVPLKGHTGLDFWVTTDTYVLAVDPGRVTEIGEEPDGVGAYLKVEHRWGESFYAHIDTPLVDSGQLVTRSARIATIDAATSGPASAKPSVHQSYLHFGIRIRPFNRFDGWGGFVDPMPYLNPAKLVLPSENNLEHSFFSPHAMAREYAAMRRP